MEKKTIGMTAGIAGIAAIAGWAIGKFVKTEKSTDDEKVIPAAETEAISEDAKEIASESEDTEE